MKSGDLVKLKSGSHQMTIRDYRTTTVECIYFDNSLELKSLWLSKSVLVLCNNEDENKNKNETI